MAAHAFENASYTDQLTIAQRYLPEQEAGRGDKHAFERKLREDFAHSIPTMATHQHVMLMIDLLMTYELDVDQWNMKNKPETMLAIAAEIGINADIIGQEVTAEIRANKKAAKSPPTPTPAAPAAAKAAKKKTKAPAGEVA